MQALRASCSPSRSTGREPDITEENLQARIRGNLADGALEQVRLARADDRQQVGDVGGLRDALRRHGRRLRRAQGRLQALGVPARRAGATSRRVASWCPRRCSSGRRRRSCATSSATTSRCRPTTCSTRSSRATSSRTWTRTSSSRRGLPREDVERVVRMVDLAEYKRRQAPPGIRISTKAFGRDRRLPITNRYGGLSRRAAATSTRLGPDLQRVEFAVTNARSEAASRPGPCCTASKALGEADVEETRRAGATSERASAATCTRIDFVAAIRLRGGP